MFRAFTVASKLTAPRAASPARNIGSGLKSILNGCEGASIVKHGPGVISVIPLGDPSLGSAVPKIPPCYVPKGCISSTVIHGGGSQ